MQNQYFSNNYSIPVRLDFRYENEALRPEDFAFASVIEMFHAGEKNRKIPSASFRQRQIVKEFIETCEFPVAAGIKESARAAVKRNRRASVFRESYDVAGRLASELPVKR